MLTRMQGKELYLSYIAGITILEICQFLINLNIYLHYDPEIPLLGK